MSIRSFIKRALPAAVLVTVAAVLINGARVSAAQIPYNPGGTGTSTTPAFNVFTGVPNGVGNEADFVKLRTSTGDPKVVPTANPFIDPVNDDCKVGDMYDIRTYVHNGADPSYNNGGSGTAVAHNVHVSMSAPVNQTSKTFTFRSAISASNANSVVDTGTLNCGSDVRIEVVPSSVYVYSKTTGWNKVSDSSVNGTLKIGSEVVGSGDVFACWDGRVLVVYTVKVVQVPQEPVYSCDLLTVTALGDRKYKFDVTYTAKNGATFKSVSFNYGDGQTGSDAEHTFAKDGVYKVVATVTFMVNGQERTSTSDACAKQVTVTTDYCPVPGKGHLPKGSPECEYCPSNHEIAADDERCVTPTSLPNTGAGSVAGLFAVVTAAGAAAYRFVLRRRTV